MREGVAYARSVHGSTEASCRIDLDAFLDSLVFDYQDMNKQVSLTGKRGGFWIRGPMRCVGVLVNLVDNALKFAGRRSWRWGRRRRVSFRSRCWTQGRGIAEDGNRCR